MQIPRTIAAEMSAVGRQRNDLGHDNSRRSHQRQTDKWLTRRTEQLHLLAVFAYRALAAQAAMCLRATQDDRPLVLRHDCLHQ